MEKSQAIKYNFKAFHLQQCISYEVHFAASNRD